MSELQINNKSEGKSLRFWKLFNWNGSTSLINVNRKSTKILTSSNNSYKTKTAGLSKKFFLNGWKLPENFIILTIFIHYLKTDGNALKTSVSYCTYPGKRMTLKKSGFLYFSWIMLQLHRCLYGDVISVRNSIVCFFSHGTNRRLDASQTTGTWSRKAVTNTR